MLMYSATFGGFPSPSASNRHRIAALTDVGFMF
jgi:hypothetical protein